MMRMVRSYRLVLWALLLNGSRLVAQELAIANVTVVAPAHRRLIPGVTVIIQGDKIRAVNPSSRVKLRPQTRIVDGKGKFLIPGLWDMHVHMAVEPDLPRPNPAETFFAPMYIVNGITGVRCTSGSLATTRALRAAIAGGRPGPQIVATGQVLDGPDPRRRDMSTVISCPSPEQGRHAVQELKRAGADFIKVYEGLDRDTYTAIATEAQRSGLAFVGHVPASIDAAEASRAGQKSIEHLSRVFLTCSSKKDDLRTLGLRVRRQNVEAMAAESYDSVRCEELFDVFRKNGTWHTPTLVLHEARVLIGDPQFMSDHRWKVFQSSEGWMKAPPLPLGFSREQRDQYFAHQIHLVQSMHRAGIRLLAGTDSPNPFVYPGDSIHDELRLLVRAGLTTFEALQTATSSPAEFFGFSNILGSIEPRKDADMVLLDANPIDNISNTRSVAAVFAKGRFYDRADLSKLRSAAEAQQPAK